MARNDLTAAHLSSHTIRNASGLDILEGLFNTAGVKWHWPAGTRLVTHTRFRDMFPIEVEEIDGRVWVTVHRGDKLLGSWDLNWHDCQVLGLPLGHREVA